MRLQCSTCLERMSPEEDLGSTPCGHVFHMVCVLQWFENKKNCPQCRTPVRNGGLRKIFLTDTEDGDGGENSVDLQSALDTAKLQLRIKETERSKLFTKNQELEGQNSKQKEMLQKMEVSGKKLREQFEGLKSQKMLLQGERARADQLEEETKLIRRKVENLKGVELALRGQEGDLNQFLHERGAFDARTKDLANLVILLKQKLIAVKVERSKAETQLKTVESRQGNEKAKVRALETQVADLQAIARNLSRDLEKTKEENLALEEQLKGGKLQCKCVNGVLPSSAGGCGVEDIEEELLSEGEDEKDHSIVCKLPAFSKAGIYQPGKIEDDSFPQLSSRGILPQQSQNQSERLKGGSLTQHYDGLGGRERQLFQTFTRGPISSSQPFKGKPFSQPLTKFPSQPQIQSSSQPVAKKRKMPASKPPNNQMKTMDKFFGGFDTP